MNTHDFQLVNVDTDSVSFSKANQSKFTKEEMDLLLTELNSYTDELIVWEDDGYFKHVLVVKAKNYVLDDGRKLTIKGSGLRATNKEIALKEFISEMIDLMLKNRLDHIHTLYNKYAVEIMNLTDITRWVTKKTITEKVLNPERTQEQKVFDAIDVSKVQQGDKIWTYFKSDESIGLEEDFNGDYCQNTLLNKLYKTLVVFETLIDPKLFPNYKTKRNKSILDKLLANKQ